MWHIGRTSFDKQSALKTALAFSTGYRSFHTLQSSHFCLVAQKTLDNSGIWPLKPLQSNIARWQQRPETPTLISRIHTSSSHHAPRQCSDSAEEWIRPGSNHPPRRKTAPPATPVGPAHQQLKRHESENHPCTALVTRMPHGLKQCSQQDVINSCIDPQQGTMHGKELNCHYAK